MALFAGCLKFGRSSTQKAEEDKVTNRIRPSLKQVIFSKSVGFQEPPEDLDDLSWARASLEAEQLTHFHAVVTDKGRIIGASSWRQSWRPQEQETEGLSAPLSLDATFKALSALIGAQHAAAALELAAVKGQPVYRAQVVYTETPEAPSSEHPASAHVLSTQGSLTFDQFGPADAYLLCSPTDSAPRMKSLLDSLQNSGANGSFRLPGAGRRSMEFGPGGEGLLSTGQLTIRSRAPSAGRRSVELGPHDGLLSSGQFTGSVRAGARRHSVESAVVQADAPSAVSSGSNMGAGILRHSIEYVPSQAGSFSARGEIEGLGDRPSPTSFKYGMLGLEAPGAALSGEPTAGEATRDASFEIEVGPAPSAAQSASKRATSFEFKTSPSEIPEPGKLWGSVHAKAGQHQLHPVSEEGTGCSGPAQKQHTRPVAHPPPSSALPAAAGGAAATAASRESGHGLTTVSLPKQKVMEVSVQAFKHPDGRQGLAVSGHDIGHHMASEALLCQVAEAQLRVLADGMPRHMLDAFTTTPPEEVPELIPSLARHHSGVCLLFMDIVGFTDMSKVLKPQQVMSTLNRLYNIFDRLVDLHGVTKLGTAGDCYIASAGVMEARGDGFMHIVEGPTDPRENARRMLGFAQAMLAASRTVIAPHNGQPITVRIGLHTGDVMSGLIGFKLPKFSIYGDAMNTASRMESTAPRGRIQVSCDLQALLPEEPWEATGGIEVKGKGLMQTYLYAAAAAAAEQTRSPNSHPHARAVSDEIIPERSLLSASLQLLMQSRQSAQSGIMQLQLAGASLPGTSLREHTELSAQLSSIPSMDPGAINLHHALTHADSAPEESLSHCQQQADRPAPGLASANTGLSEAQSDDWALATADPLFLTLFHTCRDIAKRSMTGSGISTNGDRTRGTTTTGSTAHTSLLNTPAPNSAMLSSGHSGHTGILNTVGCNSVIISSHASSTRLTRDTTASASAAAVATAAAAAAAAAEPSPRRLTGGQVQLEPNAVVVQLDAGASATGGLWANLLNANVNSMRGGQGRDGEHHLRQIEEARRSSDELHRGYSLWDTRSTMC